MFLAGVTEYYIRLIDSRIHAMMGLDVVIQVGEPRYEKDLIDKLDRYSRDYNWIKDNHSELLKKYPLRYIAVRDREVQHSGESMRELLDEILEKDEDPSGFAIEFLTDEKSAFIF